MISHLSNKEENCPSICSLLAKDIDSFDKFHVLVIIFNLKAFFFNNYVVQQTSTLQNAYSKLFTSIHLE